MGEKLHKWWGEGIESHLRQMKVSMVIVMATKETVTPIIPMICRDSRTPGSSA